MSRVLRETRLALLATAFLSLCGLALAPPTMAQCVSPPLSGCFGSDTHDIVGPETVLMCPAGDGPRLGDLGLTINYWAGDVDGTPFCLYPNQIELQMLDYSYSFNCNGGNLMNPVPSGGYWWVFEESLKGGGYSNEGLTIWRIPDCQMVSCCAWPWDSHDPIPITVTSPDYNDDGVVNIIDFTIFGNDWAGYAWRSDFNGDQHLNAVDFTLFSNHWQHFCY